MIALLPLLACGNVVLAVHATAETLEECYAVIHRNAQP